MLAHIAIGSVLILVTTVVHALCTAACIAVLRRTHPEEWAHRSTTSRVVLLSALVLMMFVAALLEVSLWASTYLAVGALHELEPALYFSSVTFTTLGYGDLTLDARWRLLASFEAANGTLMFGWTTAIVVAAVHRMIGQQPDRSHAAS